MLQWFRLLLSPFRHKNYRQFFFVQSFSLIGTWSHDLARAWIVVEIIGRASALGLVLMAVAIPSFFLILQGGVIVDRMDARRLMILTKAILAVSSLTLAAIVEFGDIQLWHLFVFALIEGCVVAFDSPAYQTITPRLVPRADFQQAMAINSTNFHMARMAGPVVAAILMALHGPSLVFMFDGLSYLGLIFVLTRIDLKPVERTISHAAQKTLSSVIEGFRYIFLSPGLRYKIIQLLLTISTIFPIFIVVFRTYIKKKFGLEADEFGFVFTFPAMGSMFGAFAFTALRPKKPILALRLGVPMAAFLFALVPFMPTLTLTTIMMGIGGFFTYLSFASLTVSLHLEVAEEYRGRLASLIGMSFISIGPLMSYPIGLFADTVGFEESVVTLMGLYLLTSALLAYWYQQSKPSSKRPSASERGVRTHKEMS